jgi:catechol 2,3-dioxygenase-like lactoylglutathione lyase family enzyme
MPGHAEQTSPKAVVIAAEPELFVADIKTSLDFYTQKLGFSIASTYGEPPFFAQVKRDAARLNLKCVASPAIDPEPQRPRGAVVGGHDRCHGRRDQ